MNINIEKYRAPVVCNNCGFRDYAIFPKGTLIRENPCPNCKCKTLRQPNEFEDISDSAMGHRAIPLPPPKK